MKQSEDGALDSLWNTKVMFYIYKNVMCFSQKSPNRLSFTPRCTHTCHGVFSSDTFSYHLWNNQRHKTAQNTKVRDTKHFLSSDLYGFTSGSISCSLYPAPEGTVDISLPLTQCSKPHINATQLIIWCFPPDLVLNSTFVKSRLIFCKINFFVTKWQKCFNLEVVHYFIRYKRWE